VASSRATVSASKSHPVVSDERKAAGPSMKGAATTLSLSTVSRRRSISGWPAGDFRSMNIIEAMEGPFSPWFTGTSWNAWKAVLAAAFALPLTHDQPAAFDVLAG